MMWRDVPRLGATLVGEVALLGVLWLSRPILGSVSLSHFGHWVDVTAPSDAFTALVRLGGIVLAVWLLASSLLYAVATVAGVPRLVRSTQWATLPLVRRMVDGMAAASIVASTMTAAVGSAGAVSTTAHTTVDHPRQPDGKVTARRPQVAEKVREGPSDRAVVNDRIVGRHLPHPGVVAHASLVTDRPSVRDELVSGNSVAGLAPGTRYVIVAPGDCLSVLAQRHLGNWRLDTEIGRLNAGRVQPDGRKLTDDHWIYPGWLLVLPADATGAKTVPIAGATPQTSSPAAPPTTAASTQAPTATAPAVIAPVTTSPGKIGRPVGRHLRTATTGGAVAAGSGARRIAPSGDVPSPTESPAGIGQPDRSNDHRREDSGRSIPVGPAVGVAGVVAAGVIWRLGRRRRDQMHDRRSGQNLPVGPASVVAAETEARAIADDEAMRWVDAGLRYLGGQLADPRSVDQAGTATYGPPGDQHGTGGRTASRPDRSDIPSVVLVRAGNRGLEVMISPPSLQPPAGWEQVDDGAVWVLDPAIDLEDLEDRAAGRWPLVPALVTVGTTVDGVVLANLEHAGSLGVEGDPETVRALLAQMLLELTAQPWADEMLAGLHAVGASDAQYPPGVNHDYDDPMALAEMLDAFSDQTVAETGIARSVAARRAVDREGLPHVTVAFDGTADTVIRCLVEAAVSDRSGVAVVVAGAVSDTRWRLSVDADGHATLAGFAGEHPFRLAVTVAVNGDAVALLGQALTIATRPPETAAGLDASPDDGRPPETGAVEIRLLGPVRVVGGTGRREPARRDATLAVLAYLATRKGSVPLNEMAGALWPPDASKDHFGMPAPKTMYNVISRARRLLGTTPDGAHRISHTDGGYALTPDVTTDWTRFQRLVGLARAGPRSEATDRYRQALDLVVGAPFGGNLDSQFFEWASAELLDYTIAAAIVDASQALADLALEAGDHDIVIWAVERGLAVDPAQEQLYQMWMHALGRTAGADKVTDVWRRLCTVLQDRIDPLQEPTSDSRAVYRTYVARQTAKQ